VPVRRLGWFLVGAAGATGALVAAPGLYGRLREAVGAGDPWNEFELEPDGGYASLRDEAPADAEAVPAEPEPDPEPAAEPEPEPVDEVEVEPEPVVEPEPEAAAEPEHDPGAESDAVPEAEPDAPAEQSGVYETVVWPVPSAQPAETEPPGEGEVDDDDTAEITSAPLTPAPPPEDNEATDLRSRIEASRERLHRKATGEGVEDEGDGEPDEPDEPDPGA
jgi:hypothetical protein